MRANMKTAYSAFLTNRKVIVVCAIVRWQDVLGLTDLQDEITLNIAATQSTLLDLSLQVFEYTSIRITKAATPVNTITIYRPPPINIIALIETLKVLVTSTNLYISSDFFF